MFKKINGQRDHSTCKKIKSMKKEHIQIKELKNTVAEIKNTINCSRVEKISQKKNSEMKGRSADTI